MNELTDIDFYELAVSSQENYISELEDRIEELEEVVMDREMLLWLMIVVYS